MNIVMIIPTGIGCEIGGHAGDATPAAKLLGACCDKIILHPNVVNASDINEMPENALYVEGSILDRFLEHDIQLEEVWSNKILIAINNPLLPETINAVSAARTTSGIEVEICVLNEPLIMKGYIKNGIATGNVYNWEELIKQVWQYSFEALAVTTVIDVAKEVKDNYLRNGGVNPWGGVEAKASRLIASELNMPVAHAPVEASDVVPDDWKRICDPRMAAEFVSLCYVNCVLKGLHRAPRIGGGLSVEDIDYLITPAGCMGRPHEACMKAGIPIIVVKENTTALNIQTPAEWIYLNTYLEVAGFLMSKRAGITLESVRRPVTETRIL